MPRFSANLTMLFAEVPFLDRFAAAADAGFTAVEYQLAYEFDKDDIAAAIENAGVELVLHNMPAGDWAGGDRGIAADPNRVDEFREGVAQAIDHAVHLGCPRLNCLAGIAPDSADPKDVRATLVANLKFAAEACARHGITLLSEPVNTRDIPGFFLSRFDQAQKVLADVGADNLKIQYDVYHMQIMHGDLVQTIADNLQDIGHIQIADNPGRHEPGTGEINFPFLFAHLDRIVYDGFVGAEYMPAGQTRDGLGWLSDAQAGTS